ncbi:glycosyltransferase family 2 protein [Plectonema cf. radiosum LEGE 06105]|uniref:Glycosyltransferase family 2 protein n=1 Tax=Plectonema cf. radiosum LEGE 06105 TaxID=945769 RepID=A0A8J7JVS1_9CYAN|nr:glycosyltransferase family 2 protein [Plectonema radiosum]MBE9216119.1 glycosyltransferase family 2 protein [Plectonema cf. radiosum LEGE 06105]
MKFLAIALLQVLLGWLVIQVGLMFVFVFYLGSNKGNSVSDNHLPKTAIILCLRGTDPFLLNCLKALLQQDYPQYDLKIVVDSQEDPAWQVANNTIANCSATNVQISPLKIASTACSLKCSSLVQAVSELDSSYQVVALVDADTVVHSTWLRELVTPLMHPKVGATTGNRWYLSKGRYWGTLVRYLWNVSAVVQMYLYGICWGGTLAIKTQVIHETGMLEKWARAFNEDTMVKSILAKHNLKVKFVPSLLILNREQCTLSSLMNWMKRQLLASRLYHPQWWLVVVNAVFSILLPNLILGLCLVNFLINKWDISKILFVCYSIYIFGLLLIIITLETAVRQVIVSKKAMPKFSFANLTKILIGIPLTHWFYGFALVSSMWISRIYWRNIVYRIKSPFNIQLTEYHSYQSDNQAVDNQISL